MALAKRKAAKIKAVPPAILRGLLYKMLLIRRFEEKIIEVYPRQDMKTPVHLYIGEEAIAAAVCLNLRRDDYLFSTHRSHGHCLAKGMSPQSLLAEFYGRGTGCCRGKGGSMHPAAPELGILGTSAIVGGGIALAVGAALACRMKRNGRVAVAFFGDGAVDEGVFHESLNFAALKRLPVVFVCENNFYSVNSPQRARQPQDDIAMRAAGYGMEGLQVDGNEALEIYELSRQAVQKAREGGGPTLIECRTYRWRGHVGPDCDHERGCRPAQELLEWMKACPLERYEKQLLRARVMNKREIADMRREIDRQLQLALDFARQSPLPQKNELYEHVYYERC